MAKVKGKPVMQTQHQILEAPQPAPPPTNKVEVIPGNVPVITVQLLSSINTKLELILQELKKNG